MENIRSPFLIILLLLFSSSIFSQVGVGTLTPSEELDVNGDVRVSGGFNYSASSSFVNDIYSISLNGMTINGGALPEGILCMFIASNTNSGPSFLNIDNGIVLSNTYQIVKRGQILLSAGDIITGELVMVVFNGTDFQLVQNAMIPNYLTDCSGSLVNILTDENNCGSCGNACPTGYLCVNGSCQLSCQSGLTNCGGVCVNIQTDKNNCGSCGNACPTGYLCVNGSCQLDCQNGLTNCGNVCVDTQTDENNCGACGTLCPTGYSCLNGSCQLSCQSGLTKCNNICVDTMTDENNCGSCGTQCPPGEICVNGSCVVSCQVGLLNCSGACVDTQVDNNNCGGCGIVCPPGQCCDNGRCI